MSHFHQPPPAPFHLNPAALAPWQEKAGSQHVKREQRHHGRRSAQQGDLSPPSRSSSDSYSTASHSASDSRSSPSPVPSPRSQSSNDRPKDLERGIAAGKQKSLPVAVSEGSDDSELPEGRGEEKHHVAKTYENTGASKHRRRRPKKDQEGRVECSYPQPSGSAEDDRKDQRSDGRGEDNSPHRQTAKSYKDHEIKRRQKRDSAKEKFADGHSDSRHGGQGQDKRGPSKGRVRSDKDKYGRPRGKRASESRSERAEKRKRQEKASSPLHKTEKLQMWKSESHDQPDKKEKKERQTRPLADHIWEEGMKVKAQKKISINISLDTRRKEVKTDNNEPIYLEDAMGKAEGEHQSPQDGGSSGDAMEKEEGGNQDKKEPVGIWDVTSSGDHKEQTGEETSVAEDSWLRALGVAEEEPRAEKRCRESALTTSGEEKWRSVEGGSAEVLPAMCEEEETGKNLHGGPQVSGGDSRSVLSPGLQLNATLE